MKLQEIHIRDPFVLLENDTYYLYGTNGQKARGKCNSFIAYTSSDLENWSEPIEVFRRPEDFWGEADYWAPEVHKYNNKFYMLASFKAEGRCRASHILVSDKPEGPFLPVCKEPITPEGQECLDATLYVDKNHNPYVIYCHEWKQVTDGEICAMRLSEDLSRTISEPKVLFTGSAPGWSGIKKYYVTDGPFVYRTENDELLILWSSFRITKRGEEKYVAAISRSDNGEIDGNWTHDEELLFSEDGGHGMIFESREKEKLFVMHSPNKGPFERACLIPLQEVDGTLKKKREAECGKKEYSNIDR